MFERRPRLPRLQARLQQHSRVGAGPRRPRQDARGSIEHLKSDRTEQDILYELLLKLASTSACRSNARLIAGKTVHSIGGGVLLACLADEDHPR